MVSTPDQLLVQGKVETKSGTDSMVRKGSTQSLNSLTLSPVSQDVSSSALKSSTSLSSESTSTSSTSPRDSTESAENEKSESKDLDPPSIDDISVVPHDRSRTLPAILPSGLLWSLSRVLGAKKTDVPLDSDTDTDSSDDTSDDDSQPEKSPSEATAKADDALNISPTDTKTKSHPDSGDQQPPSKPERAALSARTNSRDRVVISEAQVLIEDLDDENDPFTDSHALPNSIGASPASQFSGKDSLKQSTPSPSLSATTLSYLTGTSASGSTWSLQSSGQSLMKRIFKPKNEVTLTEPNTEQSTPSTTSQPSAGLRGSSSPSAVFAAPDPFSDFDQEFNAEGPEGLASVSTGSMKRRSFIIPGAFPGFGASQPEDGPEEPSEPKYVPMYSPSAGEVLVTARSEATKRRSYVVDDTDTWPNDELLNTSRSDGSHSPSDKPSLSPLKSELPRYYPASPTRRPRAYSQHLTNPMLGVNSLNNPSLNQEPNKDKPSTLVPSASRSPQPPKKPSSPKPKSSSSPSVLSIAQVPASLASTAPPSEEASSLLTPSITPKDSSGVDSLRDGSEILEASKDQVLDSTIDYTRYKEEITESNYARYSWPSGEKPFETQTQDTDSSDMSESIVSSDQSSGSSPLIVEVISSGLRSSSQDHTSHTGANAMSSVTRPGAESQPSVPSVHSFHQSQLKNNPPPPPPPRNARRPRSKTLGKYPSREKIEADDISSQSRSVSAEASSSNSPWDEPTMHAQAPAHVPHLTMVLTANATNPAKRPDIPGKEVIMEEMGSSEARNLIDADHQYYQSDKRQLELQTALPPNQSGAWSASSQHSDPSSANEAMLVATLRNQIASLASERDQFYQEAMLLRQKHDMLSNIVNNMGVAVESIQVQQQQQQQQQHILQQQQQFQSQAMGSLSSMTVPVMASSGRGDTLGPNPYPHQAHQHQGHLEYTGQFQESQTQFSAYPQPPVDQYLRPQDQLQQMHQQNHRPHLQDVEQDIRVRQLSDEYSIQISRNSEDFGSRDYYLQQTQLDQVNNLGYAQAQPDQNVHTSFMEENGSSYLGMAPQVHQHLQQEQQLQIQHQVQPAQPLMFGEGYDILSSADNSMSDNQASLSTGLSQLDYAAQHQIEEDQMRSGLTLQQLKLQHQQNQESQFRLSTDTRHSSRQSSTDGFQLTDIITTRPMSGSFVISEPAHQTPDYGYGYGQQASNQGYDGSGRPASFREQPHHNHIQQELDQCPPGSHLRRHHSMIHPQISRQSASSLDMMQHQQQGSHGRSQPRPPVWASSNLNRSSTTGSGLGQHRRQMSNPQELPPVEKELLLLSSSTSFLNNNDMYGVESPPMSSMGINNHSLLSAVVQQEKVRIEEKTSAENGAAGWSERPSPMISKSKDPQPTTSSSTPTVPRTRDDANKIRDTNKIREQFDSFLSDEGRLHQKGQPDGRSLLHSEVDSDTDSDDEMEEVRHRRGQGGVTGSSIAAGGAIGRSKTATTGVHQLDSSTPSKLSNVGSTTGGQVRHHSSSGSLRSVARHSELRRGDSGATKKTVSAPLTVDSTIDKGALSSSTGTKIEVSPHSSDPFLVTNSSQTSQADALIGIGPSHRQYSLTTSTPTVSRQPKALDLSPVPLVKKPPAHMMDEEGGDYWGSEMQAQPRRYNSVKLGMTGSLHGVTRRAIGRPAVERGRSIERGPEDCV
ncbi:hypothetical protein BGZ52_007235 [Haplosporangium bisporale]|nr:hypothetical protein BGZ52_007235 [Haplosporangium bisporale]